VLIDILEGLHQAERLIDVATDGSVVEGGLDEHALGVDDVEPTVGVAGLLDEATVLAGDGLGQVRHERNAQRATQTALLAGRVDPRQVRVLGIHRHTHHLRVDLAELLDAVAEGEDFGGAHEGEVQGVEEQHQVLPLEVGQFHTNEVLTENGFLVKVGGGLTNESGHGALCWWWWWWVAISKAPSKGIKKVVPYYTVVGSTRTNLSQPTQ
jgi:hypothetical protein